MKKKVIKAFAIGLCLTTNVMAQIPSYVPTNGLVGFWPFNGNANDESQLGTNGIVSNAILTTDRNNISNSAYYFNGINAIIDLGVNNSINSILSDITLSYWVKLESGTQSTGNTVIASNSINGGMGWRFISGVNSNSFSTTLEIIINGNWNVINSAQNSLSFDQWYYVVHTRSGSIGKTYINGIQVGTSTIASQNINNPISPLAITKIGCNWPSNNTDWFKGIIDDLGIWNRALSECEIQDLYNSQLGSFSNANVSVNLTSSAIGSNATLTVSSPVSSLQWQSNPGNMGWNNIVDNGNYNGAANDTLVVSNLQLSNHNQLFRVLACGDTSNVATIQIADTCITSVYDTLYTTVTDTLIINTTLSLPAPNNENTILIYPNPANDHITFDNGNYTAMAGYSIKIENNAGQQVFQSTINQAQFYVDLSTWTGNGLYFVHLIDPQGNTVTLRKIVLQ
jgi:hypothetical protein